MKAVNRWPVARPGMENRYYQVTEWGHPDEPMETCRYGTVTYKQYLEIESIRWMESNLRDSWLQENEEGLVALFSLRDYMRPVGPVEE
jgi:hypothetical protein